MSSYPYIDIPLFRSKDLLNTYWFNNRQKEVLKIVTVFPALSEHDPNNLKLTIQLLTSGGKECTANMRGILGCCERVSEEDAQLLTLGYIGENYDPR